MAVKELATWKRLGYAGLKDFLTTTETEQRTVQGESGFEYQLEIRVTWEEKEQGLINVSVIVENVGRFLFFRSICESFRMYPDGTLS